MNEKLLNGCDTSVEILKTTQVKHMWHMVSDGFLEFPDIHDCL